MLCVFLFVVRIGDRKHLKDGFKGSGWLLAWDCILVVHKVMRVDLSCSATKSEAPCTWKPPSDIQSLPKKDCGALP